MYYPLVSATILLQSLKKIPVLLLEIKYPSPYFVE